MVSSIFTAGLNKQTDKKRHGMKNIEFNFRWPPGFFFVDCSAALFRSSMAPMNNKVLLLLEPVQAWARMPGPEGKLSLLRMISTGSYGGLKQSKLLRLLSLFPYGSA